ncbi:D-tyrosyl-tRNA(Tyr) deacylase [Candidatus Bathyarchaeota archaeon]|nr:D-tyrosyl-tRNA(Tyr) deacylase [Candidatus Bathyarchaeota archaeon]
MILFIASKIDEAGLNIARRLIEIFSLEKGGELFLGNPVYVGKVRGSETAKLVFVDDEPVNTQDIPYPNDMRIAIFISRHSSKSGTPTLSVHTPGNIGEASLGGVPEKVSISPASAMKAALLEMKRVRDEMDLPYEVSYECTHHGPSIDYPAMFVELGSTPDQWRDIRAAEAVARGAMAAAENESTYPTALGIGGPHYNGKFTRIALTSNIAFGHIIPKYALSYLNEALLRQCVEKTVERVERVILDWKGIRGEDKDRLVKIIGSLGLEVEKV